MTKQFLQIFNYILVFLQTLANAYITAYLSWDELKLCG